MSAWHLHPQLADDTVHQLLHSIGATHFHDETPTPGHTHS